MNTMIDHSNPEERADNIKRIDSHIHLWDLSVYKRRDWLKDKPSLIRDFSPTDAAHEFDSSGVSCGIVVEAVKYSVEDNLEWLRTADESPRLLGAVTGCYLQDPELLDVLDQYGEWQTFVGVRATPNRESNQWNDLRSIEHGLDVLCLRNITLEILAQPADLPHLAAIAERYPSLAIVVDHCGMAKPESLASGIWREGLERLAEHPKVFMKYSGFAMLGKGLDDRGFFSTVAETLVEILGPSRLIWGSNWPVDSLWVSYGVEAKMASELLPENLEPSELEQVYSGNALRAYGIRE